MNIILKNVSDTTAFLYVRVALSCERNSYDNMHNVCKRAHRYHAFSDPSRWRRVYA